MWPHSTFSKAKILGNSELFIKSGSDINLTCVALQSPAPPSFIYWYKGGRVVNYSQRGGISVLTERQTKTSKLVIARAMPSDSGNYTCSPSSSAVKDTMLPRQ
uniref:Ig-like domain-containing protein n=1 Tax=Anopheles albimanus TaxID=7167 RepID=A0A182FS09_ANOAL